MSQRHHAYVSIIAAFIAALVGVASCAQPNPGTGTEEPVAATSTALSGNGYANNITIASGHAISAGATSVITSIAIQTPFAGWIAIDPYTTNCDYARITSISGTTITFSPATANAHSAGAPIFVLETSEVTPQLFGATGNGSGTGDTTGIQNAANSVAGTVVFPAGQYVVSQTINVTQTKVFRGAGTSGAGLNGNPPGGYGVVIDHNFKDSNGGIPSCSQALFYVTGDSNTAADGAGGGFQDLTIRQAYNNGTTAAGIAVCYYATSTSHWSTWNRIRNVNFELVSGMSDWSYAIKLDGSAITTTEGQRDTWIENCRVDSEANALGSILAYDAKNLFITNTLLNSSSGNQAILKLDGLGSTSNENQYSGAVTLLGVSGTTLSIDHAYQVVESGGTWSNITTTANTDHVDLRPKYLVNSPTFSAVNSSMTVGIYVPTGQPATWAGGGVLMETPSVSYQNGTAVTVGTSDNNQFRFMTNSALRGLFDTSGNLELFTPSKGLILKSPSAFCYQITVSDTGVLSTTSVTCPL